jgi:hypothetical protein
LIHLAQASSLRTDQRKLEACATLILFADHDAIIVSPAVGCTLDPALKEHFGSFTKLNAIQRSIP